MKYIYFGLFFLILILATVSAKVNIGQDKIIDGVSIKQFQTVVRNFLHLSDTPTTYTGSGGMCVVVNSGATGLEFVSCNTISGNSSNYWDNLDTPADISGYEFWYNHTLATYNLWNAIWTSTYNATYAGLINNASYLSTYNETYAGLINNASYLSTYNSTYDAKADYQFTNNNFNGSGNFTGDWIRANHFNTTEMLINELLVYSMIRGGSTSIVKDYGTALGGNSMVLTNFTDFTTYFSCTGTVGNGWCNGTDVNRDGIVDVVDASLFLVSVPASQVIGTSSTTDAFFSYVFGYDSHISELSDSASFYSVVLGNHLNLTKPDTVRVGFNQSYLDFNQTSSFFSGDIDVDDEVRLHSDSSAYILHSKKSGGGSAELRILGSTSQIDDGVYYLPITGGSQLLAGTETGQTFSQLQIFAKTGVSINVAEKIEHYGDTDTFFTFVSPDKARLQVGGMEFADWTETFGLGTLTINRGNADLDFVVRGTHNNSVLSTDAGNDNVIMAGNISTGTNAGSDLCIDVNNKICRCGECA